MVLGTNIRIVKASVFALSDGFHGHQARWKLKTTIFKG